MSKSKRNHYGTLYVFFTLQIYPMFSPKHTQKPFGNRLVRLTVKQQTHPIHTRHGTLENHPFFEDAVFKFSKTIQLATFATCFFVHGAFSGVSFSWNCFTSLAAQDKAIKSNSLNHRENGGKTLGMGAP